MSKSFQAYGTAGKRTASTPKQAAVEYFLAFPKSRKCNIVEGVVDGHFFTVSYGRVSQGNWPQTFKDISKKDVSTLPDRES